MYYELSITTRKSVNSEIVYEKIQFPSLRSALERAMFETKASMSKFFRIEVACVSDKVTENGKLYYVCQNY